MQVMMKALSQLAQVISEETGTKVQIIGISAIAFDMLEDARYVGQKIDPSIKMSMEDSELLVEFNKKHGETFFLVSTTGGYCVVDFDTAYGGPQLTVPYLAPTQLGGLMGMLDIARDVMTEEQ